MLREGVIPRFYPIGQEQLVRRATEKYRSSGRLRDADGLNVGRDGQKAGVFMWQFAQQRILSRGLGRFSPLNLALVGSFHLATGETGATSSGVRAKNPAMKSSTMKGAKALESELCLETVPNREKLAKDI
jgi:hypothetical protein